ncbi:MAG: hypothetical protein AAEJ04_02395 [Planctomycetota bacterium]
MKKIWVQGSMIGLFCGVIFGVTAGWAIGGGTSASADYPGLIGLWEAQKIEESYDISIGVDGLGKPRPARGHSEQRTQLLLPQHYGNLVGITGNESAAILWYQDGTGVIRNAIIPDAASHAVRVQLQNTQKVKGKVVRD